MLNAHKQGEAKLYGHTGCSILISSMHYVLFYTEALPISFAFSLFITWSVVTSGTTNKVFCGYFLRCLSVMTSLDESYAVRTKADIPRGKKFEYKSMEKKVVFHTEPVMGQWVLQKGGYRVCSCLWSANGTIFTNKAEIASFVQLPH